MTTQPTLTLADFLLARIAEDEAVARACPEDWYYDSIKAEDNDALVAYVDRFARARVLAECEAKRRIVEATEGAVEKAMSEPAYHPVAFALLGVASLLALPYAGHPDYREEWRP